MLDMGFEDEIDAILAYLSTPRQNLLFSATFPDEVDHIVRALSPYAVRIDVTESEVAPSIAERWCHAPRERHTGARAEVLGEALTHWGGTLNLVFCNTKLDCAEVSRQLGLLGFSAVALHGDMEQHERSQSLIRFANGSANVLVATDVAARGLDIDDVDAVFNFELPHQAEIYVHRIGRTARGGREGVAISLVSDRKVADFDSRDSTATLFLFLFLFLGLGHTVHAATISVCTIYAPGITLGSVGTIDATTICARVLRSNHHW